MVSAKEMLGVSRAIEVVREQVHQLLTRAQHAHRLPPILLQGETGTGKGLLARLIHRESPRRDGPFVDVSCATIPDALLEAELFGFERGAFTDARQAKPGLLQAAHRGTLFLDEVALLPETLQAKLLKAIEERTVRRLGSTRAESVDVQVIAASNEDLAEAARSGRFRNDLYHRLAVVTLTLPPLRERPEDVLLLAEHFLSRTCADYGLVPPRRLAPDARSALQGYRWPGNVRELSNVIESAVLLAEESTITAAMLGLSAKSETQAGWSRFDERVRDLEREQLLVALNDTNWNVSRAAIQLGISRNRLRYRIEKHHLDSGRHLIRSGQRHARSTEAAGIAAIAPKATAPAGSIWEGRHLALLRVDLLPPTTAGPPLDPGRALTVIADKIRSFGGCIEEVAATTIVGVFGLEPIESAPSNAALAALAIQNAAERARRLDLRAHAVKIAVHTGQLLVGRVDGRAQIDLKDKRATEDILAELSEVGQSNSIVISAAAAPFLESRFELARDGPMDGGAGLLYRLTRPERTGFGLGGRALARFVGRERELTVVGDRLAQAERHRGQIVAVVGEPGVGKSRFVYEVTRADFIRGWRVLSCRAFSYGVTTPSLPVIELLRGHFQIDDAEAPSQIREKVSQKVLQPDRRLDSPLPALLTLLDVSTEDPVWRALEPGQRRQQTLDAVKHVLLQESVAQPLLVIFEDLHWIDTETQGLLDSLVESLPAARVLLLVTYRPEYRHRWGAKTYYTQLHLGPLTGESAQALLQQLLGEDPSLLPLKRLLIERTEGNPLFLEESVRALAETGALQGSRGTYRLNGTTASLEVPATIQAILASRIDRLSPEDKRLLQAAAVIGKDIPYALLAAIAEQAEETLRGGLARLQEAEFLYETQLFPDVEHTFKHALTHEVTYLSLLQDRRHQLHAQIVAAIERLYAERLSEHVERLAHHALRGQLWEKAVRYGRQAGTRALDRSAAQEALAHFQQARATLRELPESRERTEQLIDLCFEQRNALLPLGEFARLGELVNEGRALAERLGDQRRLGWALAYQSHQQSVLGELAHSIVAGQDACAIAETVGALGLRIVANHYLGQALCWSGDPCGAACAERAVINLLGGAPPGERFGLPTLPAVIARWILAAVQAELGEFAQAIAAAETGLCIAQSAGHPYSEVWARIGLGYARLRQGDFRAATRALERGLALTREMEFHLALPFVAASLGSAYLWSGRAADAVLLLEEAAEAIMLGHRPWLIPLLAEAYLALGRIAEAREQAEQAVALARTHPQRAWEAWGLKLHGDVRAHEASNVDQSRAEQAADAYRQALALATGLGMRPLAAHCHFGLGKLCQKVSEREQAPEHFATATMMYREMDMQFWLEQAEAACANSISALGMQR